MIRLLALCLLASLSLSAQTALPQIHALESQLLELRAELSAMKGVR